MADYDPQNFSDLFRTPFGEALWEFLNRPEIVALMDAATFLQKPAVEPLATPLLEYFGSEIASDRTKQFIGHMVRHIMTSHGCAVDQRDVRIVRNSVFSTGTRYIRPGDPGKRRDGMRITREQREAWSRSTQYGEFNRWFDPQVRNADGGLNLDKLYAVAQAHGVNETYRHLNPGQQRMIIGVMVRNKLKKTGESGA